MQSVSAYVRRPVRISYHMTYKQDPSVLWRSREGSSHVSAIMMALSSLSVALIFSFCGYISTELQKRKLVTSWGDRERSVDTIKANRFRTEVYAMIPIFEVG